jgi:hypothetical protein
MKKNMARNKKMKKLKRFNQRKIIIKIRSKQMIMTKRKTKTSWKITMKILINKSKR